MNILNNKFIKYVFFAILTSALNVGSYILIYNFIINDIIISNITAYIISISASFIINKNVVFKNNNKGILKQLIFYLIVKSISLFIDSSVLIISINYIGLNNFLSKIIANSSTTISNYTLNNKLVFKQK